MRSGPSPTPYLQAALGKLGADVPREKVIVVGDSPHDAEAAGKANLRTVGVLCGGFPEERLTRAGCIAIFKDPEDLLVISIGHHLPGMRNRNSSSRAFSPAATPPATINSDASWPRRALPAPSRSLPNRARISSSSTARSGPGTQKIRKRKPSLCETESFWRWARRNLS